ncbi:MAG: TolC family protein [Cyclobacteriaceae bacterium]|nr:TolC family protein [Cyclobacteriaceae bacterium]
MVSILQKSIACLGVMLLALPIQMQAQTDSLLQHATLERVVNFALKHQPAVQQALLDQEITERAIKGKLADWYPQINFVFNYQHNFELPVNIIGGNEVRFGVDHTSATQFNATQTIFNRDVLLAGKTASQVRLQSSQVAARTKIDVVVNVTKAFYDVLATLQQIKIGEEDIIRLKRSLKDASSQYAAGVADKTDYKRATILLRNSEANLKSNQEALKYKHAVLKTLIGYPDNAPLNIVYDSLQMENEVALDTLQLPDYTQHIDYQILYTQKELQAANVSYSKWSYLPSANLFGSYNFNFLNNSFNELYNTRIPNSYAGVTLSLPLFQGNKRNLKVQEQTLGLKRIDWDLVNLQSKLTTEYTRAMASYKSSLASYLALQENVALAREVYDVIQLQYKNGVRAYLDVTIAETDLRSARISYFNALYQVLASKLDVQKALNQIKF